MYTKYISVGSVVVTVVQVKIMCNGFVVFAEHGRACVRARHSHRHLLLLAARPLNRMLKEFLHCRVARLDK